MYVFRLELPVFVLTRVRVCSRFSSKSELPPMASSGLTVDLGIEYVCSNERHLFLRELQETAPFCVSCRFLLRVATDRFSRLQICSGHIWQNFQYNFEWTA